MGFSDEELLRENTHAFEEGNAVVIEDTFNEDLDNKPPGDNIPFFSDEDEDDGQII